MFFGGTHVKTTPAIIVIGVALTLGLQGQSPDIAEQAKARMTEIQGRLKLTPQQIDQIRPILQDEVQKMKALRDKYQGDTSRSSKRHMLREAKSIQEDGQSKINPLLTKDQQSEWKKIRDEQKAKMREEFRNRRG